jgi:hypothetical protein
MSKIAHFFNIDCFVKLEQKAWIVDKSNPSNPLMKLSQSEFKLAKNGLFKKKGNKIDFNGITYYLSDEIWNRIKVICIKNNINISNLVISLQEFLNPDIVDEIKFDLDISLLIDQKNDIQNLYLVCPKFIKNTYNKILNQISEKMKYEGLVIKNYYFIEEDFVENDVDEVQYKKMKLMIQHLIGYKSEINKFVDDEIEKYDTIHWFDTSPTTLNLTNQLNDTFRMILNKTDSGLMGVIKDDLSDESPVVWIHRVQDNLKNPIITKKSTLSIPNIIRKFESFKFYL